MAIELYRQNTQMVRRSDQREIGAIHAEAAKAAARVNGMSYVGHVALQAAGMLTMVEGELIARAPLAGDRYRPLIDAFILGAAQEIIELRWRA